MRTVDPVEDSSEPGKRPSSPVLVLFSSVRLAALGSLWLESVRVRAGWPGRGPAEVHFSSSDCFHREGAAPPAAPA